MAGGKIRSCVATGKKGESVLWREHISAPDEKSTPLASIRTCTNPLVCSLPIPLVRISMNDDGTVITVSQLLTSMIAAPLLAARLLAAAVAPDPTSTPLTRV